MTQGLSLSPGGSSVKMSGGTVQTPARLPSFHTPYTKYSKDTNYLVGRPAPARQSGMIITSIICQLKLYYSIAFRINEENAATILWPESFL